LADEHLFEAYQKKIRERMNDIADSVSTGSAKNFEEYQHMVGTINGLALAERELLDLVEAMKKGKE
tara:strand:- start:703 stop:900 length:198 start_codon:yes stop_codon:yes gene_type:complete